MDNLILLSSESVSLTDCEGPITGLEHRRGQYYLILCGELNKIVRQVREQFPTPRQTQLLPALTYNVHDEKVFFGDGRYFYYQSIITNDLIQIHAPFQYRACQYSAPQDKVAVLGSDGQVNLCDITAQYNITIQVNEWSMNDPVPPLENLNWGTAENQFSGFDNTTAVDIVRNATGLPCEDESVQIKWRSDGKFFLIAYSETGKRRFKVFDVSRGIYSENEDIPGLQAPISWRVTQSMVTMACCSDDVWRLIVFEAKGFAKIVVDLDDKAPIVHLEWDETGTILAVHQKAEDESYLLLYTVSNFSFQLKQKLVFSKDPIRYIQWEQGPLYRYHLIVVTETKILHYQYIRRPIASAISINGGSTCASIDNKKITIVDFEQCIVPPPHKSIDFGEISVMCTNAINRVVFNASRKTFLVVDCRNLCYVFNIEKLPRLITSEQGFKLPIPEDFPLSSHHFMFYDNVIIAISTETGKEKLLRYDYCNNEVIWHSETRENIIGVLYIKSKYYTKEYMYSSKGELYVNGEHGSVIANGIRWLESIMFAGSREYIFILDNTGVLYCNDKLISANVVSFIAFNQYFMFTTIHNTLYSCRLDVLDSILNSDEDRTASFDHRVLEEGAKLVAGVTSKLTAIVQLPRGNLEMVCTDLLGIDLVNYLLNSKNDWEEALNKTRLRLLNPNILVDTDFDRFLANVSKIISIMNVQAIIDFLLTLTECNVIETLSCRHQYVVHTVEDKISRVCKKFIDEMEAVSTGDYIEAIMVARVKVFGLEHAVTYAKNIYDETNLDVNKQVQRGLEAISRYWNAEDICNLCLRTYDLDFCLFAHYSYKKDPQLTAMLIDSFRDSASSNEMRFKVNNYIGDYKNAAIYYTLHLLENGPDGNGGFPVQPLIEYAQTYEQLEIVYLLLRNANICISEISKVYGEYLEATNDKMKAAEVYRHALDYEMAYSIYVSIFQWNEALAVLEEMHLPEDEKKTRMQALADHLSASGMHKPAAQILQDLAMYESALECLTRGHFYKEATVIANEKNLETKKSFIKENMLDYVAILKDLFLVAKSDVEKFSTRIETILYERVVSMQRPPSGAGVDYESALEYAESLRSGLSTTSRSSRASSRSTRKEQRRYTDLKEGGPYEDIAIMRAVYTKVEELTEMKPEISSLLFTMVEYDLKPEGTELQKIYSDMLEVFRATVAQIWFPGLNAVAANVTEQLTAARKNLEFMEEKYREAPSMKEFEWKHPSLDS